MYSEFIYGLPVFSHLSKSYVRDLHRLMFLSLSWKVYAVQDMVKKIYKEQSSEVELKTLVLFLEKSLTENEENKTNKNNLEKILRLQNWIRQFPETSLAEIEEYFEFYNLSPLNLNEILELKRNMSITNPGHIKAELDKVIIGQHDAKKVLSFSFYLHLIRNKLLSPEIHRIKENIDFSNKTELPKPNILLLGSTGSGKTLTIKTLCSIFNIPFIKIDCSSLTSSGYIGNNISTYLKVLLNKYGSDKAKHAVVFFDEFDKLSERHTGQKGSVGGVELQQEFLTFLEDKETVISRSGREAGSSEEIISTENMMFVFSGSFAGIEKIIHARLHKQNTKNEIARRKEKRKETLEKWKEITIKKTLQSNGIKRPIGFKAKADSLENKENNIENEVAILLSEIEENKIIEYLDHIDKKNELEDMNFEEENKKNFNLYKLITHEDIIEFGIIPELAGRLGFIAVLDKLTKEDIIQILKNGKESILEKYRNYFIHHYDTLIIKEEVYPLIAEEVLNRKIGARAINGVIIKLLQDLLYEAPNKFEEEFIIDEPFFKTKFK